MREDNLDRVSRLGSEAWKRLKKTKDYNDWLKVGEALQCGREWAMRQAQANKPEGKAYNMAFSEWLQRYKLDDMDKGDRSRLFQVMDALPQIEEWRRTLTLTERLKLNHPNAVLRKFKLAFEIPDPSKPVKPGLRDAVAELSEENLKLKNQNARLTAHIEEVEATFERVIDRGIVPKTLLWVANGLLDLRFQAPTVRGVYDIKPQIEVIKRKKTFVGNEVRFVRLRRDDPEFGDSIEAAENDDIRIIATGVQTDAEAKSIAQADFNTHGRNP